MLLGSTRASSLLTDPDTERPRALSGTDVAPGRPCHASVPVHGTYRYSTRLG